LFGLVIRVVVKRRFATKQKELDSIVTASGGRDLHLQGRSSKAGVEKSPRLEGRFCSNCRNRKEHGEDMHDLAVDAIKTVTDEKKSACDPPLDLYRFDDGGAECGSET
jgi:hypothetical protein